MVRRSRPRGRFWSDRGAAAVETAIVLPVLLFVIFGVIDFGRMLNAQLQLTQAAREGARAVVLHQPADTRVQQAVNLTGVATSVSDPCGSSPAVTDDVTVTTTYTFQYLTPMGALAALFHGNVGSNAPKTLTGRAVMSCNG